MLKLMLKYQEQHGHTRSELNRDCSNWGERETKVGEAGDEKKS